MWLRVNGMIGFPWKSGIEVHLLECQYEECVLVEFMPGEC